MIIDIERTEKFIKNRNEGYSLMLSMRMAGIAPSEIPQFMKTQLYKEESKKAHKATAMRSNSLISMEAKKFK